MADTHLFSCLGDPLETHDFTNAISAVTSKPVHQGGIGTRLTLRSLRHFESAILNSDWLKPALSKHTSTVKDLLADLQAGHTTDMADGHYGVVTHRLPHLRMHDVTGYIAVSTVIHRWWRLAPQDDPQSVTAVVGPVTGDPLSRGHSSLFADPSVDPARVVEQLLSRLMPVIHSATRESAADAAASLTRTFLPKQLQDAQDAPSVPEFDWSPPQVDCLVALRSLTGNPFAQFKSPEQALAVQHVLERKANLLLVSPTGSGKSLAFLLPMYIDRKRGVSGLNLVVAPYVLLCREIRDRASSIGLSSLMYGPEVTVGHLSNLDCLTCTPDALETRHLRDMLATVSSLNRLARVFVDEVHHVLHSAEFRPAFSRLASLRDHPVPVVLLTATLPPSSVPSLLRSLSLTSCPTLRGASSRPTLRMAVTRLDSESLPESFLTQLESHMANLLQGERGMVFCGTVADVDQLANLCQGVVKCHARMSHDEQLSSLSAFAGPGGPSVMVATSVLGNGLDVPNVRFVLHYGSPRSVVDYLQESGRAGRDGVPSTSHVYPFLSQGGSVIHPECEGLCVAEMREWTEQDDRCRRWGLSLAIDGKGETCTSLPGCVPCDVCSLQLFFRTDPLLLLPPPPAEIDVDVDLDELLPLVVPPPALEEVREDRLPEENVGRRAVLRRAVPELPPPTMDVLIDQRIRLGQLRGATAERDALNKLLDTLRESKRCLGCWCRGRDGTCKELACVSATFFTDRLYRDLKRGINLPDAHCWHCGIPQVCPSSYLLLPLTSSYLLLPFSSSVPAATTSRTSPKRTPAGTGTCSSQ